MDKAVISVFLAPVIEKGIDLLSSEEDHQSATGIVSKKRRHEFVSGRLLLRQAMRMIGEYATWSLHVQPDGSLRISFPQNSVHDSPPAVNLSHSRGMAMCALGKVSALGADIELRRPRRHLDALAEQILHPQEFVEFTGLDLDKRIRYFHAKWVQKEALGKALGCGVAYSMQQCLIQEGWLIEAPREWVASPEQWHLWETALESGYSLGLAWRNGNAPVNIAIHHVELEI